MNKSWKLASHVLISNNVITSLLKVQILLGIVALFEQIYDGEQIFIVFSVIGKEVQHHCISKVYTAKTQFRKFEIKYSRKGTVLYCLSPNFHIHVSVRVFYITMFGYRYNQLPRLNEQTPQWLSGPSPLPPAAGPLADYQTGSKLCSDALQLLFNYWHGLT